MGAARSWIPTKSVTINNPEAIKALDDRPKLGWHHLTGGCHYLWRRRGAQHLAGWERRLYAQLALRLRLRR